jgi:3-dehydroquinate synthase
VLDAVGLPTSYRADRFEELVAAMRIDKKSRGDMLRFVILDDVAQPVLLEGPQSEWLVAAYAAVGQA